MPNKAEQNQAEIDLMNENTKAEMIKVEAEMQAKLKDQPVGTDTSYIDTWGLLQKPQMLCTTAVSLLLTMIDLHKTGQFKDETEQCRVLAMRNLALAIKAFDEYERVVG